MPRPRDADLDAAILAAAAELLNERGVPALTVDAVAARAGTTRPAIYRRYDSLTALLVAALGQVADTAVGERSGDPHADLTSELEAFRDAVARTQSVNVAASVLLDATSPDVKAVYRERIVAPRRARIRAILSEVVRESAPRGDGADDRAADLEIAVTLCTGSWYAFALAGEPPPGDWPARTASLVLRALRT